MIDRVRPYAVRDGRRFAREVGTAGAGTVTRESFLQEALERSFASATHLDGAPEPPLTRPVPGRFYAIQAGHGGLLQTATRAYGVPLQPNPIRLAQLINNHPYNRRFWRAPANAWERAHFREGIISFSPRFACTIQAQTAASPDERAPDGRCFATIWIPPTHDLAGTRVSPTMSVPMAAAPQLINYHTRLCRPVTNPLPVVEPDLRRYVPFTTGTPYKWICSIFPIFRDPSNNTNFVVVFNPASGVMIGRRHVLTAAHVVRRLPPRVDAGGQVTGFFPPQTAVGAIISPGRNGLPGDDDGPDQEALPFGELFVDFTAGARRLRVPRRFVSSLTVPPGFSPPCDPLTHNCEARFDAAADYALIRFRPADIVSESGRLPDGFWGGPAPARPGGAASLGPVPVETIVGEPPSGLTVNKPLSLCGYPEDKPCEQWESSGSVTEPPPGVDPTGDRADSLIDYETDAVRGYSGAPLWAESAVIARGKMMARRLYLVGIQSGRFSQHPEIATAVRLGAVWPTIAHWLAQDALRRRP